MDRAPVLSVGDMNIGQSKAIERYVAKRCNMMGSTDEVRHVFAVTLEKVFQGHK